MARKTRASAKLVKEPQKLRYQAVHDLVLQLIAERGLKPGDKLPSATELVKLSGVSLISVRHALDKLENAGRIRRHQGIGTFVARERIVSEPSRSGELLQTLTGEGTGPALATEVLHIGVGLPSASVAKTLGLETGQPVWEVVRRRSVGARPAILEQAILPLSLVPALDEAKLTAGESLYRFLADQYGLRDERTEQFFEVVKPDATESEFLKLTGRDQVVRIRGVSCSAAGVAFDCWRQTYRASDFVFYMAGSGDRQLLQLPATGDWAVRPLFPASQGRGRG
ncbi:GntR family transcriptional regulator [Labrys neptuniae]